MTITDIRVEADPTPHVFAGTREAGAPEWERLYRNPGFVGAACKQCGAVVDDLTMHQGWHDAIRIALFGA